MDPLEEALCARHAARGRSAKSSSAPMSFWDFPRRRRAEARDGRPHGADSRLIMALANPTPEIHAGRRLAGAPDALICTGRSDYPNQVNNVLCFPYIFRGALDVGATTINEAMKIAAVEAIAGWRARRRPRSWRAPMAARRRPSARITLIPNAVRSAPDPAYRPGCGAGGDGLRRGAQPDHRFRAYRERLQRFVFRSGFIMKPLFAGGQGQSQTRGLFRRRGRTRAARRQSAVEERIAHPILIGRRNVVVKRLQQFGLTIEIDKDFQLIDPSDDPRYKDYVATLLAVAGRAGINPETAKTLARTNASVIGALALKRGEADALLCGLEGRFASRLKYIKDILGLRPGASYFSAMWLIITAKGAFFLTDTHVRADPRRRKSPK